MSSFILLSGSAASNGEINILNPHFSTTNVAILVSMLLVMLSSIVRILLHRSHFERIPESASIILSGAIVGIFPILLYPSGFDLVRLDAETFLLFLLPPLILDAGYFLHKGFFIRNLSTILLFAVLGTVISSVCTGLILFSFKSFYSFNFPLFDALTYGALISAVDPVAVLSIFSQVHVNETLNTIVFGESVLNDAVSIVLYQTFLSLRHATLTSETLPAIPFIIIAKFLVVSVGGILLGTFFALLAAYITKYTQSLGLVEPVISFVSAYSSYVLAEILSFSGIFAIMVCGTLLSRYTETNISRPSQTAFKYMLKVIAGVTETLIFLFLGTEFDFSILHISDKLHWDTNFFVVTIVTCLFVRLFVILALSAIVNRSRAIPIPIEDQLTMAYSGLRGAIAFVLAIVLPSDMEGKEIFVTTTCFFTMGTIFIQGSSMKFILDKLQVRRDSAYQVLLSHKNNSSYAGNNGEESMEQLDRLPPIVLGKVFDDTMHIIQHITGAYHDNWDRVVRFFQKVDAFFTKYFVRDLSPTEQRFLQLMNIIQQTQGETLDDETQASLEQAKLAYSQLMHSESLNLARIMRATDTQHQFSDFADNDEDDSSVHPANLSNVIRFVTSSGDYYYYNTKTDSSSWDPPQNWTRLEESTHNIQSPYDTTSNPTEPNITSGSTFAPTSALTDSAQIEMQPLSSTSSIHAPQTPQELGSQRNGPVPPTNAPPLSAKIPFSPSEDVLFEPSSLTRLNSDASLSYPDHQKPLSGKASSSKLLPLYSVSSPRIGDASAIAHAVRSNAGIHTPDADHHLSLLSSIITSRRHNHQPLYSSSVDHNSLFDENIIFKNFIQQKTRLGARSRSNENEISGLENETQVNNGTFRTESGHLVPRTSSFSPIDPEGGIVRRKLTRSMTST